MGVQALAGRRVLVTRPTGQSKPLAELIASHGGTAVTVPLLLIDTFGESGTLQSELLHCAGADVVIFVSPNAVQYANAIVPLCSLNMRCVVAPGAGTASALEGVGIDSVVIPQSDHDSDAMLNLDVVKNVRGAQICIVRGQGGRERLRDKLVGRGAIVRYLEVYRRIKPPGLAADLAKELGLGIDIVLISSGDALQNLDESAVHTLDSTPVFVPSQRIATIAATKGFKSVHITGSPDDAGVLNSLLEWAESNSH